MGLQPSKAEILGRLWRAEQMGLSGDGISYNFFFFFAKTFRTSFSVRNINIYLARDNFFLFSLSRVQTTKEKGCFLKGPQEVLIGVIAHNS